MGHEELTKKVIGCLKQSRENDVYNWTLECFENYGCNIMICRNEKRPFYDDTCKIKLEPLVMEICGEDYRI